MPEFSLWLQQINKGSTRELSRERERERKVRKMIIRMIEI
jgi:hypothetical protein